MHPCLSFVAGNTKRDVPLVWGGDAEGGIIAFSRVGNDRSCFHMATFMHQELASSTNGCQVGFGCTATAVAGIAYVERVIIQAKHADIPNVIRQARQVWSIISGKPYTSSVMSQAGHHMGSHQDRLQKGYDLSMNAQQYLVSMDEMKSGTHETTASKKEHISEPTLCTLLLASDNQ